MGFGREARRVRDVNLPLAHRFHALGSCINLAQPIGFHATWRYLEQRISTSWRDPKFPLPALSLLQEERAQHLAIAAEYADLRRSQKALGRPFPVRGEATPVSPRRWHGDECAGARIVLENRLRRGRLEGSLFQKPQWHAVVQAAELALSGSILPSAEHLQDLLEWSRRQRAGIRRDAGQDSYFAALRSQYVLGDIYLMTFGPPPIGRPWNFVG